MRRALSLTLLLASFSTGVIAQDTRYVSDKQLVPLRSGPGGEYRVTHRGIPSGTRLEVASVSEDGKWANITTDRGTTGWTLSHYLMSDRPAQVKLDSALKKLDTLSSQNEAISTELATLKNDQLGLRDQLSGTGNELETTSEELQQLKQISGNAVQLDINNRRLTLESETLKSEAEMLKAENQRLQDNLKREDFINGALAVLMGVLITLIVPRLWPKRRKSSTWA